MPPAAGGIFSKRNVIVLIVVVALVVCGSIGAYFYRQHAQKLAEDEAARNAAAQAAESQNPFQSDNPLSGVETNPFEKTKKALNPFE